MRSLVTKTLMFAALAVMAVPSFGQTAPSVDADIVVELSLSKLMSSPTGEKFNLDRLLGGVGHIGGPDSPDFSQVDKVLIGIKAPADFSKLQKIQGGGDLSFFAQMHFEDAATATSALEVPKEKADAIEKDGKTYYAPINPSLPVGTVIHQAGDTILEMASEDIAYRSNLAPPITAEALKAMSNTSESLLRLTVDGANAREFLKDVYKQNKATLRANPIAAVFVSLLGDMDTINLVVDLSSENLVTLDAVGSDEESATDMHDALLSAVTTIQPLALGGLQGLKDQDEESAAVFAKLIKGMTVKREGTAIAMKIPRPEGFEGAVGGAVKAYRPLLQLLIPALGGRRPAQGGF